ncbi:MAG: serine hydrolase domain-containing protein [Hyphomonadaceae bacterium]
MNRRAFLSAAAACSAISASAQLARAQPSSRFADAARYSADRNGASFLVVRHGIVLSEEYRQGTHETRWQLGEGTRPFAALLAATLIEDRLLSLDEPVALTLGDWALHPVKSTITVRALLGGVSGLAFGPRDERTLTVALALEPVANPGEAFSSDAAAYVIFAEIARRKLEASGRDADPARYLTDRTLGPIGCAPIGWTRWPDGAPRLDDGVALSARSWAQAGELIRREGVWRAQQLADDNALREAMRGSFAEARAGFGLWLAVAGRQSRESIGVDTDLWRAASPAPIDLAMAAGAGGQRLYLSPSAGIVIVRQTPSATTDGGWSDAQFLSLVWRGL